MRKIIKQIVVNSILVIVSVAVIFIAKTFANEGLLEWKEYLGSDIIFVMITSLVTTVGWRFSENIVGHWLYNVMICVILFFFSLEYGMAMIKWNDVLLYGVCISFVVFLFFYFIENCIIIYYFKKTVKVIDKLSYSDD